MDENVLDLAGFESDLNARSGCSVDFRERNAPVDAVAECSAWLCFRDENEDYDFWEAVAGDGPEAWGDDLIDVPLYDRPEYLPPSPYLAPPKVGRNDPCPCGSGRKYKKCCGK